MNYNIKYVFSIINLFIETEFNTNFHFNNKNNVSSLWKYILIFNSDRNIRKKQFYKYIFDKKSLYMSIIIIHIIQIQ